MANSALPFAKSQSKCPILQGFNSFKSRFCNLSSNLCVNFVEISLNFAAVGRLSCRIWIGQSGIKRPFRYLVAIGRYWNRNTFSFYSYLFAIALNSLLFKNVTIASLNFVVSLQIWTEKSQMGHLIRQPIAAVRRNLRRYVPYFSQIFFLVICFYFSGVLQGADKAAKGFLFEDLQDFLRAGICRSSKWSGINRIFEGPKGWRLTGFPRASL